MAKDDFVSGIYKPQDDARNKPVGNFKDHVNRTVDNAIRKRRLRKKFGAYDSVGARATPETVAAQDRMIGEQPRFKR